MEQVYFIEDNGKVIFKGTAKEIKEKFQLSKSFNATYYAMRGIRVKKKYKIGFLIEDDHIKWQTTMLRLYGNTTAVGNPKENLKELQDLGFNLKLKCTVYRTNKGKREESWILECMK